MATIGIFENEDNILHFVFVHIFYRQKLVGHCKEITNQMLESSAWLNGIGEYSDNAGN